MSVRSIARELGVSATAVSLALKGSARVSPALRERVQRAARASGHVPNARLAELMQEVRRSAQPAYRGTLGVISLFPEEEPWRERPAWGHLGRFVSGARGRVEELGYKLEHFWLKRPGMTPARLRAILEARGIPGLLCLGSLDPEEAFPPALRRLAVVTQGASIPGPLHRVQSHFAADARLLYGELLRRGYRRPACASSSRAIGAPITCTRPLCWNCRRACWRRHPFHCCGRRHGTRRSLSPGPRRTGPM